MVMRENPPKNWRTKRVRNERQTAQIQFLVERRHSHIEALFVHYYDNFGYRPEPYERRSWGYLGVTRGFASQLFYRFASRQPCTRLEGNLEVVRGLPSGRSLRPRDSASVIEGRPGVALGRARVRRRDRGATLG
eukprot:35074-Chlamydomonas_euryale.AAC.2